MATRFRRGARAVDIWPGFVDALATLLLVLIFLLVVFVVAEFFLGRVLSGREDELAGLKNANHRARRPAVARRRGRRATCAATSKRSPPNSPRRTGIARTCAPNAWSCCARRRRWRCAATELAEALRARADGDEDAEALRLLLAETRAALAAARAEQYDAVVEAAESQSELDEERRLSDAARERLALLNSQLARLRTPARRRPARP